jgi:pimeloyl-ACP methyl ester carboxylesterase
MPSRRRVILSAAGIAAVGAGSALFHCNHQLPSTDPAAERRFRELQDALLARYGVPAQSRFLEIRDPQLRVHVVEAGQGQPVLFIHGGNSVAASWAPLLGKLQKRSHAYAPDRPGCGLTTKFLYTGIALRQHAVAFVGSVFDELNLQRASIVANSMGGYFALVFTLAHPERVAKLVLVGEPAGSAPQTRFSFRLIGTRIINSALFATVLKPGPQTTRNGFARMLVADIQRVPSDYLECMTAGATIPGAVQSWITLVESVYRPPGAGLFSGASTLTYLLRPELPNLATPTLLLWGERDAMGDPSLGQEMAGLMKNGKCEAIPDAGHVAWLDKLDQCSERIEAFLA